MTPVLALLAIVGGILFIGIIKNLPTWLVLGIVTLVALHYRRQAHALSRTILAWQADSLVNKDPWATPNLRDRRAAKRGLTVALNRTELCAVFPGRGF